MQYIKTLKKFVAGSDKFFDVFACTVDEVDEYKDSNGRKSTRVVIDGEEIKGMHNKRIFNFLVENEGNESFVVLWKSNKGNYLLSYAWELWKAYAEGDTSYDLGGDTLVVTPTGEAASPSDSFVYMWINLANDMKYIGVHKGTPEDGYICSNERLLSEYKLMPEQFHRTILAYGPKQRMHELETLLLIQLGAAKGDKWYNLSNNLRK